MTPPKRTNLQKISKIFPKNHSRRWTDQGGEKNRSGSWIILESTPDAGFWPESVPNPRRGLLAGERAPSSYPSSPLSSVSCVLVVRSLRQRQAASANLIRLLELV